MKRRQIVFAVAMVLIVALVAVGFGHPQPSRRGVPLAATVRTAGQGMIIGAVETCGGPVGGCRLESPGYCAPTCEFPRYVEIRAADGALRDAEVKDARFLAALPPGHYALALIATGEHGLSSVLARERLRLSPNATRNVTFKLAIP